MRTGPFEPPKKVVLLHPVRQPMGQARRRAEAMALALGARLTVVKLTLPRLARGAPVSARLQPAEGALQQALREVRIIERWQALREKRGAPRLEVTCCAPSVEDLLVVCGQPGVALVVMPASEGWFASRVTTLAARAGVPVLLAHATHAPERAVVAATSLEDSARPVISQAVGLADRLQAPLAVVHNAPVSPVPSPPEDADLERELAREVEEELGHPAAVTVTHEPDAAHAILSAASGYHADLIVVGVRTPGEARDLKTRVPERVCAEAACSVLLVPVTPPHRAFGR